MPAWQGRADSVALAVSHTTVARDDLLGIWLDIAADDAAAADRMLDQLEGRVRILESFPQAGPPRADIAPDARMLVEPPYLILYRLVPDGAQVVRVLHGARHIGGTAYLEGLR